MDWLTQYLDAGELLTRVIAWLPQLGTSVLILLAFVIGSRVVRRPLSGGLKKTGLHRALVELLVDKILHYTLIVFGLIMALDQLGVDVTTALAGLGVAGIAVGFAAQDTLANLISGITIFLDKPFLVDDWVTTGDEYGQVTNITLRTTRIRTNRNSFVVIPNRVIIDSVLENHSKHGELRIDVPVGIAYKEDIDRAREVLVEATKELPHVGSRGVDVVVEGLGGSSVDLLVRAWTDEARYQQPLHFAVVEASKKALDKAGIEIPFPHLQLFVDDVREPVWEGLARLRGTSAGD